MAGSVDVRVAEFPKDIGAFIDTWWTVFDGNPAWVPPLRMDIKKFLHPDKNPYFDGADVQPFIAWKDGRAVGTIAATVDREMQTTDPGVGLFGFFEFIDDPEVSRALYEAATAWLRTKGMKRVRGPANFSTNHEFGLIVDGPQEIPYIGNPYNAPYYVAHYEAIGIEGAKDWFTYEMTDEKSPPDIIVRIAERFMKRHPEVEIKALSKANFSQQVDEFWELYNDAWEDNWGHIKVGHAEFMYKAAQLKPILDERLSFIAYVDGKPAAASITLPDYNQVAIKMNGRLFPFGWWHFLTGRKKIDRMRVLVLGVKQEYQKLPLGAPLYLKTWENGLKMGIKKVEASLILEDNHRMRSALEKLGLEVAKRYRMYETDL